MIENKMQVFIFYNKNRQRIHSTLPNISIKA